MSNFCNDLTTMGCTNCNLFVSIFCRYKPKLSPTSSVPPLREVLCAELSLNSALEHKAEHQNRSVSPLPMLRSMADCDVILRHQDAPMDQEMHQLEDRHRQSR
jgi:hypothetical protein